MKKIKYLFLLLLTSCCTLAQVPPQYIYPNAQCEAPLPDYASIAIISGGCTGYTVTQLPIAGTLLTAQRTVIDVTLKVTGNNGKAGRTYLWNRELTPSEKSAVASYVP